MLVKGGAIALGIAIVGTGGLALTKPSIFGIPPSYTTLDKDHDYSTKKNSDSDYKNKFGATNSTNLVGVYGDVAGKEGNRAWWEWSYENWKHGKPKEGKFKYSQGSDSAVTMAYHATTATALNKVCEAAYKADTNKVKANPNKNETEYFDEADVWKYCSPLGKKPQTQTNPA